MSIASGQLLQEYELTSPPKFAFVNASQIRNFDTAVTAQYPDHEFWEYPSLSFSLIPTPKLLITDSMFHLDLVQKQVYKFASARLWKSFDLPETVMRYRDIDTGSSATEVKALCYRMFDVIPYGNPFDPSRMAGQERAVRQPDGTSRREWVIDYANRTGPGSEIYFREDFVAPAPIFRATGTLWIFVTDEFAERIMRAGIVDMIFQDVTGPVEPARDRFRRSR